MDAKTRQNIKDLFMEIGIDGLTDAAKICRAKSSSEDADIWEGLIDILTGKADYIPETDQLIYKEGPKG